MKSNTQTTLTYISALQKRYLVWEFCKHRLSEWNDEMCLNIYNLRTQAPPPPQMFSVIFLCGQRVLAHSLSSRIATNRHRVCWDAHIVCSWLGRRTLQNHAETFSWLRAGIQTGISRIRSSRASHVHAKLTLNRLDSLQWIISSILLICGVTWRLLGVCHLPPTEMPSDYANSTVFFCC
jgi:hypothetical protein